MSPEALAAGAYGAFLVAAALGLDRLARHAHHRAGRFRTQGFRYHPRLDVWECPEGERLRLSALDHRLRVARYRARASACNACAAKGGCTDSDEGREVVRPLDPWPHSEAGRFHRGISVALLGLASLLTAAAMLRNASAADLALLTPLLGLSLGLAVRLAQVFLATPSGFPGEDAIAAKGPTAREKSQALTRLYAADPPPVRRGGDGG